MPIFYRFNLVSVYFFYKKKMKFLYILQEFLFVIGIRPWAVENLGFSCHSFVVRVFPCTLNILTYEGFCSLMVVVINFVHNFVTNPSTIQVLSLLL